MRITVVISAIALVALAAPPVLASGPTQQRDRHFHFEEPARYDCGSFQLDGSWTVTDMEFDFLDANGTPIRQIFHRDFVGTLTNNQSGKVATDRAASNSDFSLIDGSGRVSGARTVTGPGFGIVFNAAGTVKFADWTDNPSMVAGPLGDFYGNLAELCDYMGS